MFIMLLLALPLLADVPQPLFQFTTQRDNDKIVVTQQQGWTVLDVHSPWGISKATIERKTTTWKRSIRLRLHLSGLEHFSVSNGKTTLGASVSSTDDHRVSSRVLKVKMIGSDGKPAHSIPLEKGYFEIDLPASLFGGNPQSIVLEWIDFYRR